MASLPAFYTLNKGGTSPGETESSSDSSRPMDSETTSLPSMPSPKTHDTSRIGWHMQDLESLCNYIDTAAKSSFPNHAGSRYRSVIVALMRWEQDDLGVDQELRRLRGVFECQYGFKAETWIIQANDSCHNTLMQKALDFLHDFDSQDNLFILYYAGHGYINKDRQSTWCCSPQVDANSPTVDWSHIQGLFERSKSDVLVLLDCCAAASSAPRRGKAIMETIAACGFEGRAPPPGEHSFTTSLIEVLEDWENTPSFSVTMLHSEVLRVLMQRRREKCRNGQRLEWRSTPVHLNNYTHPRTIGIELCKRSLIDAPIVRDFSKSPNISPTTYCDLMSLSHDEDNPKIELPVGGLLDANSGEDDTALKVPHMLVSIALDQDSPLPNAETCHRWLSSFPGLAKHAKVEGVFDSYSTVVLLSIPVVIWNMLPENPACQPITYVTSRNLTRTPIDRTENNTFCLESLLCAPPSFTDRLAVGIKEPRIHKLERIRKQLVSFSKDFNHKKPALSKN